jgi:flagellar protein FlbD
MIGLTRLNGRSIVVNAELIETVESTPDTVVSLINGKKLVVLESLDDVVERVIHYRRKAGLEPREEGPTPPTTALRAGSEDGRAPSLASPGEARASPPDEARALAGKPRAVSHEN